jgi:hypothetical protein
MGIGHREGFEADVYQGPVTAQTLLSIVETADSDQLLCHLLAVDQEEHRSRTQPSNCD